MDEDGRAPGGSGWSVRGEGNGREGGKGRGDAGGLTVVARRRGAEVSVVTRGH